MFIHLFVKIQRAGDIKHIEKDEQQKLIKCIIKRKLIFLRLALPVQHI